jgi:hypothetical protein
VQTPEVAHIVGQASGWQSCGWAAPGGLTRNGGRPAAFKHSKGGGWDAWVMKTGGGDSGPRSKNAGERLGM